MTHPKLYKSFWREHLIERTGCPYIPRSRYPILTVLTSHVIRFNDKANLKNDKFFRKLGTLVT